MKARKNISAEKNSKIAPIVFSVKVLAIGIRKFAYFLGKGAISGVVTGNILYIMVIDAP